MLEKIIRTLSKGLALGLLFSQLACGEPVINIPDQKWPEDTIHSLNTEEYFESMPETECSFEGSLEHIKIEREELKFKFIPENDWYGEEKGSIKCCEERECRISSDFKLIVEGLNDEPRIAEIPEVILHVHSTVTRDFNQYIYEPEDDPTNLYFFNNSNFNIQNQNGLATISEDRGWEGQENILLKVCDVHQACSESNFNIISKECYNPENRPELTGDIPNIDIDEDTIFVYNLANNFCDPDLNELKYSITEHPYAYLEGSILYIQPEENWNGQFELRAEACNLEDRCARSNPFLVRVREINDPPQISEEFPSDIIMERYSSLVIDPSEFITDVENDPLTITFSNSRNFNIYTEDGLINISVVGDYLGSERVQMRVSDGDKETFKDLTLESRLCYDPEAGGLPFMLSSLPDIVFNEDSTFSFDAASYFCDNEEGREMSYQINENSTNLSTNVRNSLITLIPTQNWYGSATAWIRACNQLQHCIDSNPFGITVESIDDPPQVLSLDQTVTSLYRTGTFRVFAHYTDVESSESSLRSTIQYRLPNSFTWLDCNERFDSTNHYWYCDLTTTTGDNHLGTWDFQTKVCDLNNCSDWVSDYDTLTVSNNPPIVIGIPDQSTNEDTAPAIIFLPDYLYDKEDSSSATYDVTNQTNSTLIKCNIWSNIWNDVYLKCNRPTLNQSGFSDITVRITDSEGASAEDIFRMNVIAMNDRPSISTSLSRILLDDNSQARFDFTPYVTDPENDPITLSHGGSSNFNIGFSGLLANITTINYNAVWEWVSFIASDGTDSGSRGISLSRAYGCHRNGLFTPQADGSFSGYTDLRFWANRVINQATGAPLTVRNGNQLIINNSGNGCLNSSSCSGPDGSSSVWGVYMGLLKTTTPLDIYSSAFTSFLKIGSNYNSTLSLPTGDYFIYLVVPDGSSRSYCPSDFYPDNTGKFDTTLQIN